MYAVIETGGKQYTVEEGDTIDVELLNADGGAEVEFPVLYFCDGDNKEVGIPSVSNCSVKGMLVETVKGDKVTTMKFKKRTLSYKKRWGHRQKYSRVKITKISRQA